MKTKKNNSAWCVYAPQEKDIPHCKKCGSKMAKSGATKYLFRFVCRKCAAYSSIKKTKETLTLENNVIHYGVDYLRFVASLELDFEILCDIVPDKYLSSYTVNPEAPFKHQKEVYYTTFEKLNTKKNSFLLSHHILSSLRYTIDSDNSELCRVWLFGFLFDVNREKNDRFSFSIDSNKLFSFEFVPDNEKAITGKDKDTTYIRFDFYGTAFSVLRMGVFPLEPLLMSFYFYFPDSVVSRLDYCFDVKNYYPSDVLSRFSSKRSPQSVIFSSEGSIESCYFGRYSTSENKRALIRVYNKLLEAKKKKKEYLYFDYMIFSSVSRFEVEFRSMLCKQYNFTLSSLFDESYFLGVLHDYLDSNYKELDFDFSKFKKIKRDPIQTKKATIKYFASRIRPLWRRAIDTCGLNPVQLISIIESKGVKHTFAFLRKSFKSIFLDRKDIFS